MKVHVEWDLGDTEFEEMDYEEALVKAQLPKTVVLPADVAYEDIEGISDWLSDTYGYTTLNWWAL